MKCPNCGLEAMIREAETQVTGDSSPEEQTEVWTVLRYVCRNPACPACQNETVVGETRSRIYPVEGSRREGGE